MLTRRYRSLTLLMLAGSAIYLQTLGFESIEVDDPKHLFENPVMLSHSWSGFLSLWRTAYFGLYIPMTYSLWFLVSSFGMSPTYFHALNVVMHLANGILVYALLKRILSKEKEHETAALAGALIFICHPLQVEAVAWISGLKDLLSTFFTLSYLWVALSQLKLLKRSLFCLMLFILALLSKPSVAFIPLFLLIYLKAQKTQNWRQITSVTLLPLVCSAAVLGFTKSLQPDSAVQILSPIAARPGIALDALFFYVRKLFFPLNLAIDYGRSPDRVNLHAILIYPFLGLLALCLYRLRRIAPLSIFGLSLFVLALLPVLGFIPFQFQLFSTVADRFVYLGMVGLSIATAELIGKMQKFQTGMTSLVFGLLLSLSCMQVPHWKNNDTLFSHSLKINPQSLLAHNNWAFSLYHRGEYEKAAEHFARVVELRPQVPELHRNYGAALIKMGMLSEGRREFKIADLTPNK